MTTVVTQPTPGGNGEEIQIQMVENPQPMGRPMTMPMGLSPGLASLGALNEILINKYHYPLSEIHGWSRNNKYDLCNTANVKFMFARENTNCMTRQCCSNNRPFTMNITDNSGQHLIQLYRPFRCVGWLGWCCCLMEMDIMSPPGVSIGTVKQSWTPWTQKYEVCDAHGNKVFTITSEFGYCACCKDIVFTVLDTTGVEVGKIIKQWINWCDMRTIFRVQFPPELDVFKKTLLLGATILIDFVHFETNKSPF